MQRRRGAVCSGLEMPKALKLQLFLMAAVVAVAALWCKAQGAWSVAFGIVSVQLPHLLFVLLLKRAVFIMNRQMALAWLLLGELLKIVATIGILVAAGLVFDVVWPWLIAGLVAALLANLLAHLLKN